MYTVHKNVQFNQTIQLLNTYSIVSKAAIAFQEVWLYSRSFHH